MVGDRFGVQRRVRQRDVNDDRDALLRRQNLAGGVRPTQPVTVVSHRSPLVFSGGAVTVEY